MSDPGKLPREWLDVRAPGADRTFARHVCDFIAGMTDRYALDQHKRLFDVDPMFR
jgi:dGTPase